MAKMASNERRLFSLIDEESPVLHDDVSDNSDEDPAYVPGESDMSSDSHESCRDDG